MLQEKRHRCFFINSRLDSQPMSTPALINSRFEKVQKLLHVKFNVLLSQNQLLHLLNRQPEYLKQQLKAEPLTLAPLDLLIETISEQITGMNYPTGHSTPYYKEYFKKKLNDNKHHYFGLEPEHP